MKRSFFTNNSVATKQPVSKSFSALQIDSEEEDNTATVLAEEQETMFKGFKDLTYAGKSTRPEKVAEASFQDDGQGEFEEVRNKKPPAGKTRYSNVSNYLQDNTTRQDINSRHDSKYKRHDENSRHRDKKPHRPGEKHYKKKSDAIATHEKQARKIIQSLIKDYVHGENLDLVAEKLKNSIDSENGHYAKGKLLEIASSHFFHELLGHPLIKPYFSESNVREGDGHTALFWVNWPEYIKYSIKYSEEIALGERNPEDNPLEGFNREIGDVLMTIDILLDVGYTPTTKNRQGESIVLSLQKAIDSGRLPIEWQSEMLKKYLTLTQKSAEVTLREICAKIAPSPESIAKHAVYYCWAFTVAPDLAVRIAIESCMKFTPSSIGVGGEWTCAKDKINMFRNMIRSFDDILKRTNNQDLNEIRPVFKKWKSREQLTIFNNVLCTRTLRILEKVEEEAKEKLASSETKDWSFDVFFTDPLAGVLGECENREVQKNYIMKNLEQVETVHLAFYCIRHARFIDAEIGAKIADLCENPKFPTKTKFMLYDIIEALFTLDKASVIKNIDQCKAFLRSSRVSGLPTIRNTVQQVQPVQKCATVSEEEIVQLAENYCDNLRVAMKANFDKVQDAIETFIESVSSLSRKSETNAQQLVESFMARAFTDAYNPEKVEILESLVNEAKRRSLFKASDVALAKQKLGKIELSDYFESSQLDNVKAVLMAM